MIKNLFLPLAGVAAFIIIVGLFVQGKFGNFVPKNSPTPSTNKKMIVVGDKTISVELANTKTLRQKGLSERKSLEKNEGMLFIFDSMNTTPVFWMKDMNFEIDIIWINDEKIVNIDKNVQPEPGIKDSDLKQYKPNSVIDYVLEVNAGESDKNNWKEGTVVNID
jgi:uncharacterized membrane protein (UPF0127 family)